MLADAKRPVEAVVASREAIPSPLTFVGARRTMSGVDTAMLATLVAAAVTFVGLPVAFYVGKRQERARGRHERAHVYPKIAAAMDLFVDEVEMIIFLHDLEMIAAQAHQGMEESARREIVGRGTYLRNEFRRILQGHRGRVADPCRGQALSSG
jgi:hypothetical protein